MISLGRSGAFDGDCWVVASQRTLVCNRDNRQLASSRKNVCCHTPHRLHLQNGRLDRYVTRRCRDECPSDRAKVRDAPEIHPSRDQEAFTWPQGPRHGGRRTRQHPNGFDTLGWHGETNESEPRPFPVERDLSWRPIADTVSARTSQPASLMSLDRPKPIRQSRRRGFRFSLRTLLPAWMSYQLQSAEKPTKRMTIVPFRLWRARCVRHRTRSKSPWRSQSAHVPVVVLSGGLGGSVFQTPTRQRRIWAEN